MRSFGVDNDTPPEPVSPAHAELQAKALPTLDASLDPQPLRRAVELPTRETLHDAEAAVKAVDHPLDQGICRFLRQAPKADVIARLRPSPVYRLKVLRVEPLRIPDAVGDGAVPQAAPDGTDYVLGLCASPMDKTMPGQLFFLRLMLLTAPSAMNQAAVEKELLYMPIVALAHLGEPLFAVFLPALIGSVAADAVRALHVLIDRVQRQPVSICDGLKDFLICGLLFLTDDSFV